MTLGKKRRQKDDAAHGTDTFSIAWRFNDSRKEEKTESESVAEPGSVEVLRFNDSRKEEKTERRFPSVVGQHEGLDSMTLGKKRRQKVGENQMYD